DGIRAKLVTGVQTCALPISKHWLEPAERSLSEAGIPTSRIIVEEGEVSKTYAGLEKVSEALIAAKIERNDLVIALGGGVVGDLRSEERRVGKEWRVRWAAWQ